ncbi:MAG: fimbrillin family protein [Parabacteroides gordonii]|uniref:fimbrillin family protein n=1 Tax=Parabacteroides gordonii TaxID=574930 RepID=UPI003A88A333
MKAKQLTNVALSLSCCLAALTACVGEETEVFPPEKQPVGISATITGEVTTKADPDYKPASDTKIYMYYKNGGNTSVPGEKGIYTYSGGKWNAADEVSHAGDCIFWDDLVAVSGKYPFFAVSPKDPAGVTTGSVETDQSSEPNFTNADLLMAYSEVARQAKVPLIFKHMLAKLTVKVNTGAVSTTISKTSVSMENAIKDYTVTYTGTGTLSGDSPAKITTGSTRNATFTPHTESTESNGKVYVYSVILPAQDISSAAAKVKTTITISGSSGTENLVYTYAPTSATTLANGTNTTLTLTVNGTVLELSDIKVTDWGKVTASGSITLDK